MSDELRERLARLDPMHPGVPTEPTTSESSRQMMEKIMSTPVLETEEKGSASRRPWYYGAAAALVLVVAVGGGILAGGGGTDPIASGPPLELSAGGEDPMAMCAVFSVDDLAAFTEVAFAGTVTAVAGDQVTLSVDQWHRGGDAGSVVLNAPEGMEALLGGVPFAVGDQYLVSATDGSVNYCGFSGPATPELAAAYQEAFGN